MFLPPLLIDYKLFFFDIVFKSFSFVVSDKPDDKYCAKHKNNSNRKSDKPVLDEARDNKRAEAYARDRKRVRKLGGNVVNMVTLRSRR